nr:reverse transcriptase domain-containing protein [Tanacetum cinerariifolium]
MADQRTTAQLLQAPTEGYEDAIIVPAITTNNFKLKHGLLTLVQNKQFVGHDKEAPHAHVRYFNKITSTLKFLKRSEYRFDESFSEAWDRFKDLLRACTYQGFSKLHQLDTFYNALNSKDQDSLNFAVGGMVKALLLDKKGQNQSPAPVKAVEESCVTCDGAHYYCNCPATDGNVYRDNIQEFVSQASTVKYNQGNTSYRPLMIASTSSSGTLPRNIIVNLRSDLKAITTRTGVSYDRPQIPPSTSFLPKVVEDKPEATKDIVNPTNNGSNEDVQPQDVQSESPVLTSGPVASPIFEPVIAPVSTSKPNPKTLIPYPLRRNDDRNHEKANNKIKIFYQIFKDMSFKISFADALILMPKFASTLKALIGNKEKLRDPSKFLIPCMAECLELANIYASINLMPFFVWKRLSHPNLTPTCMNLELANRSISRLVGVAEDVYVKIGSFHFSADFVVVAFDADPRVPLILGRSFLKTRRALIDVFEGELTLRVSKEAITFNLDQTSRYSANYNDMTTKQIDVIGMACEEYSQEVLGFSDTISSGNPTPYYDPIVSTTSLTLTPFGNSDFFLEEVDAFLAIEDDPTSLEFYQPYLDHEGDILLLEAFLNDDPSSPPNQGNYLPEVKLKDLPPHLEYAFLVGDDKLPVIIAKYLSVEEKTALITVFKSHKRAIAWKLSDIKGIDPEFCTHKILMEEDFKPAVQHQRRVKPKIHDGGFTVVENDDNELIPTCLVMGWRVCIDYRKLNEATHKDHFPLPYMDQMLERLAGNQHYCFLDGFSGYFQIPIDPKDQEKTTFTCPYETFAYRCMPFGLHNAPGTLQRKLIEAPILISLDWDMPFELMCDASDFAIGAVLGQRQDKYFRLIHYASKTMTEAESNYTTTKKEMLAVVYAFEKFRSYLIMNKSEFTFKVIDTKGAENLAADHLSRPENPHQNVLDPKEINESFPLETLNMVSTHGNQSTQWFADFANYHARNFVVKGMSSQQKSKFFKDARKPSRLATMDPHE